MCSIPVSWMLSVQRVRPVISRWSSLRRAVAADLELAVAGRSSVTVMTALPSRASASACWPRGGLHGPDDVVVAGAPAQVALEPAADLLPRSGFGLSLSRSIDCMIMPGVQ